ncbi:MAG: hypothetical protein ACFFA5_02590 [Promethearchaeota archaeon]
MAFQSTEKETEIIPRYNPIITSILAFAFTFALSLFIWWLFIDPDGEFFIWRTFRLYEEASVDLVLNYIFLFILSIILYVQFIDPEMEFKEFLKTKLKIREKETGLALLMSCVVVMFVIIAYITLVWGEINSLFNQVRDTSLFFISSTGIFIYLLWSFFWGHWPLNELNKYKIRVLEFLWCTFLLVLTYAWFVLPAQITNSEFKQVLSLNAFIGYLYSALAVTLLLGILWENWPIARIKNQPYQGVLASSICLIGGYIFYAILALASTQSWFLWENPGGDWYLRNAANFSIFVISWIYFWAVYSYNWPNEYNMKFNIFVRTLLVLIFAALNYYVYFIYLGEFLNESSHFYNKFPFIFQGLWFAILIVYNIFFERIGLWKKPLG